MSDILQILKETEAMLPDDHFVGTSGGHFDTYINKDALYYHPAKASAVGKIFAEKFKDMDIDAVVGPAMGGVILSQWTAYHLSEMKGKEIFGLYTDKTPEGEQVLKRGYDKVANGKNILIVEDLTTTGLSVKKVVDTVKNAGGNVVAVCVMVNKNPKDVTSEMMGAPFYSLADYPIEIYKAEECPLCQKGVPVNTKIGHGKKFLESQKQ
ncbi:MAG TPA: phosphoribosyltransferase family protein [Candidatus Paceibacterota bacterium]|nr:phosphoribosyltransferase family protein [Candidatus Paceibacterota bacterium]